MNRSLLLLLFGLSLSAVSCSVFSKKPKKRPSAPTQDELFNSVPDHLLSNKAKQKRKLQQEGSAAQPSGAIPEEIYNLEKASEEQNIVWTNPDAPDESLGELETVFTKPVTGPWELSFKAAQSRMYREKKPLLIWFTDSRRSPTCKTLSKELFSTSEFEDWSDFHLVKLRIDSTPQDENYQLRRKKAEYAERLKQRFNVKGHPNVLLITPGGKTIGQYRGYKMGEKEFYFGRLKNANRIAQESIPAWEKKMDRKGYRKWKGKSGKIIFAKASPYQGDDYILSEPNGKKHKVSLKSMSKADREYVNAKFP